MAIPDFFQRNLQMLQMGQNLGQGILRARQAEQQMAAQEQQSELARQLQPMKIEALEMQNQMTRQQMEREQQEDMKNNFLQSATLLATVPMDQRQPVLDQLAQHYQGNPEMMAAITEFQGLKTENEQNAALFEVIGALSGVVPGQQTAKNVQNSREVEGGTLITYKDGTQEFKPFTEAQLIAEQEATERKPPKLSAGQQATATELEDNYIQSLQLANKASKLSEQFKGLNVPAGWQGTIGELWKQAGGTQDGLTSLRQEFTRIRNQLIVQGLPQGPATDKDIEMIAAGFPEGTANPTQLSGFLDAMARGQKAIADFDEYQVNFLRSTGNRTKARRDFDFNGYKIDKGTSLLDGYKGYQTFINKQRKEEREKAAEQAAEQARINFDNQQLMQNDALDPTALQSTGVLAPQQPIQSVAQPVQAPASQNVIDWADLPGGG